MGNEIMQITKSDLLYDVPESLIATTPVYPPRVLYKPKDQKASEISFEEVFNLFQPNDLLIINKTKVLPRRIFLKDFDIMFLDSADEKSWSVLFPAKKFKVGDEIILPEGVSIKLIEKGIPQKVIADQALTPEYFNRQGHFALPPYIQNARGQSLPFEQDKDWYQTSWAEAPGSLAAPTASLHFKSEDMKKIRLKIEVAEVTLHVGLGTFLPVTSEILSEHKMHHEFVEIEKSTIEKIKTCQSKGGRVWALGTTSLRSVEGWARGHLTEYEDKFAGTTDLFLKPGDEFKVVNGLLTNFHQPGSTLISLVSAFSSLDEVKEVYKHAIQKQFRLFSYGDLSIWTR
jgi:S-adenosylmethionine:tRNA ribosyltransferase-isomerase